MDTQISVVLGRFTNEPGPVNSGVPQGTIVSPLLSLIHPFNPR